MQKENFHIGCEFYTATGKWRCTDTGTRVIVAIKLDKKDESWYNGPPYAVAEHVFDEYDFDGCEFTSKLRTFKKKRQLTPCCRCGSTESTKSGLLISIRPKRLGGNGVTRVCTDCQTKDDKSCIRFGKYKWICVCGANIWDDDAKTDRECLSCGRKQDYWVPVDNE